MTTIAEGARTSTTEELAHHIERGAPLQRYPSRNEHEILRVDKIMTPGLNLVRSVIEHDQIRQDDNVSQPKISSWKQ